MANIATLAVYDGQATPVLHNLIPVGLTVAGKRQMADWRESIAALALKAQVRATVSLEILKSGVYVVSVKTVVPVMESINGNNSSGYTAQPEVAHEDTLVTTGYFSPRSSEASRKLAHQLHGNVLIGNVGSVAPNGTGPVVDLIRQLILPT